MKIIGIDAATSARDVGVAVATWDGSRCHLDSAFGLQSRGRMSEDLPRILAQWVRPGSQGLLAIDAPLGWPRAMRSLLDANAGESLTPPVDEADRFLRRTDQLVRYSTGKVPLSVGADRIARTAEESLITLGAIRNSTRLPLPLAWHDEPRADWSVIEVYPAASLAAHAGPIRPVPTRFTAGGLRSHGLQARVGLIEAAIGGTDVAKAEMLKSPHVTDACLAVVAAQDFLRGHVQLPRGEDVAAARREGWIWFYVPTFCRPCSEALIRTWHGAPWGFGGRANRPRLPVLPTLDSGACQVCGSCDGLPMDSLVFMYHHGPYNTGLPDDWTIEMMEAPSAHHDWLRGKGIPLPYSGVSRFASEQGM